MRWFFRPIMRPIAIRKLAGLHQEQDRLEVAISRARKAKARVSDLYDAAKKVNAESLRWAKWL